MSICSCCPVEWKHRRGYQLSNGTVELTLLTGGGHIVDFRLCDTSTNFIWEAPWQTIEPQSFSDDDIPLYGDRAIGRFLSGYTGHALVLGYFGMPSPEEIVQGLPLHGEAANSEWRVLSTSADRDSTTLVMEVDSPFYELRCRREITIGAGTSFASVREIITNLSNGVRDFQWVQHAAFGPPFFAGKARLFVPVEKAITWPLGYEQVEYLSNNAEFDWPSAPTTDGAATDISRPFPHDHTGFVVSLLTSSKSGHAFAAVINPDIGIVAGYHFDRAIFPWIALWEENCARQYAPWHGVTQVLGVEFGNTPMPLGLDHARRTNQLFDTPVLTTLQPKGRLTTSYEVFAAKTSGQASRVADLTTSGHMLLLHLASESSGRETTVSLGEIHQ